jgi:flagellar biosynthetic protein FlhB
VYGALGIIVPICAAIALISFIINGVQTRFRFTFSLLKPKLSRVSLISGFKKMFSAKSLVELLKSLFKVAVIALVLYTEIKTDAKQILSLPLAGTEDMLAWIAKSVYGMVMKITVIMAVFGTADYMYQWWSYEKGIRMTKQEVKDEYKKLEGDPQVKGKIKEIQRKMSAMRMMHNVPKADVVIKNPTHYAVALKYDPKKDSAPVVVAKGKDYMALRIIKTAEKHGVYVTENRPLARGLYEAVEINKKIPEQFYKAVAEVIAFLYRLKKENTKQN